MKIIGTKFFGHDSAIFYIDTEKKEIFATSTERVTRIKHDGADISHIFKKYPFTDIDYLCHSFSDFSESKQCEMNKNNLALGEKRRALRKLIQPTYVKDLSLNKKERTFLVLKNIFTRPLDTLEYLIKKTPQYKKYIINTWKDLSIQENVERHMRQVLSQCNITPKHIDFYDHHLCHAAGAYYFSPYAYKHPTLSLTLDGKGDEYFSKLFLCENDTLTEISNSASEFIDDTSWVTSIGDLYGNYTEALGLRRNSDEGKVEALAAYSTKNETLYQEMIQATKIELSGITYDHKLIKKFYNISFLQEQASLIGEESFASTIQTYLEDVVVSYLNIISKAYPQIDSLCLSGGVAANIIMSLNIFERTNFKKIYVVPFMGDEGTSVGAALLKAIEVGEDISWVNENYMPYYGNELSKEEIDEAISFYSERIDSEYIGKNWYIGAAASLAQDKVLAVVQGKMEFGPRALGNRSILANPVNPDIREMINLKVKKRPKYQPFCPTILEEDRERLFNNSFPHKHMAIAFRVKEEFHDKIPSAVHVDGTARPQFLEREDNPPYFDLLKELKSHTGFGVVIDTSFNLHGRTIVHTAKDALLDFLDCNIDELYLEGYKITRK